MGLISMNCLQVRTTPDDAWQNFYNGIDGFTHESGYEYELLVRTEVVIDPPADGSSVNYVLEEVVNKRFIGTEIILYVGPILKDCVGIVPQKCLQVREDPNAAWQNLYDGIVGFNHESGFVYKLRVSKEAVTAPPADGSSFRYVLQEVLDVVGVPIFVPPVPVVNLHVASYKTACSLAFFDVACLLVRDGPNGEWVGFSDTIDGFTYEPGYRYELSVSKQALDNSTCLDNCPQYRWTLLTVVSKMLALSIDGDNDFDHLNDVVEDRNGDGDPYNDDSDGDGIADFLDDDDDNDGIPTSNENPDPNGDGNPEDAQDLEGDGVADYLDSDIVGLVTIIKDTQPGNSTNFQYTGSLGNFRLDDPNVDDRDGIPNSQTFIVAPGRYTLTEKYNQNWALTNLSCSVENQRTTPSVAPILVDYAQRTVAFNLAASSHVTCTFVSTRAGVIKIQNFNDKNTNGKKNAKDAGISAVNYTLYANNDVNNGQLLDAKMTNNKGRVNFNGLVAGKYRVCEDLPNGTQATLPGLLDPQLQKPCYAIAVTAGGRVSLFFGMTNAQNALAATVLDARMGIVVAETVETEDDAGYEAILAQDDEENELFFIELYMPIVQR